MSVFRKKFLLVGAKVEVEAVNVLASRMKMVIKEKEKAQGKGSGEEGRREENRGEENCGEEGRHEENHGEESRNEENHGDEGLNEGEDAAGEKGRGQEKSRGQEETEQESELRPLSPYELFRTEEEAVKYFYGGLNKRYQDIKRRLARAHQFVNLPIEELSEESYNLPYAQLPLNPFIAAEKKETIIRAMKVFNRVIDRLSPKLKPVGESMRKGILSPTDIYNDCKGEFSLAKVKKDKGRIWKKFLEAWMKEASGEEIPDN